MKNLSDTATVGATTACVSTVRSEGFTGSPTLRGKIVAATDAAKAAAEKACPGGQIPYPGLSRLILNCRFTSVTFQRLGFFKRRTSYQHDIGTDVSSTSSLLFYWIPVITLTVFATFHNSYAFLLLRVSHRSINTSNRQGGRCILYLADCLPTVVHISEGHLCWLRAGHSTVRCLQGHESLQRRWGW